MRKLAISTAALISSLVALPAIAQDWNYWNTEGRTPTAFVDGLEWRINQAAREGRISWDQAHWLMRRQDDAKPLAWRVETNTASWEDRRRLNRDVNAIEQTLNPGYDQYRGYYNDRGYDRDWPR